jgi:hypothetical protein
MSISQKAAWAQLAIFGGLLISWIVLFTANGTIFYWQTDGVKITFYWFNAAAFTALLIMHIIAGVMSKSLKTTLDERDKAISRRAWLWASGVSYTVVIALLVALTATYMSNNKDNISVYFPQFIILAGGLTLVLTQAIAVLVLYGRKVIYAES